MTIRPSRATRPGGYSLLVHKAPDVEFHGQRCEVCGAPLGDEVYWITEHPRGVHERCRDWSSLTFPYARDLASLRRLVRRVKRATREVIAIGKRLAEIDRAWPRGGQAALAESRELLDRAREAAREIGIELPSSEGQERR